MLSQPVQNDVRDAILAGLRGASMEVIRGKGGTVFGPALHIVHLIRAVAEDRMDLLSCSCVLDGEYGFSCCSIGVPARIGRGGIARIEEWDLDEWERQKMDEAYRFIRDLCTRVGG
jgi:malate dehydrogenase